MQGLHVKILMELERELIALDLLDKTREIYSELGDKAAISFIKSSYHLLSKVYHPDLNPENRTKAQQLQQRLNRLAELLKHVDDHDFISMIKRDLRKEDDHKKKILVVEDEFGLQETFRDVFIMEGYDVRVAVDGEEGLRKFIEFKPDLLFTDVVMPKMSGLDLVKKAREINPRIKVIYISGFFGIRQLKRELDGDILRYGYHYLSKPFKISSMLELVASYLDNSYSINIVA
jgi:CheY-like chemotaxis protein